MHSIIAEVDQRTQLVGRNRLELLLFRLVNGQLFGINVFKVREVIKAPALTYIARAHPCVRGIASLRGMTVPVMDLGAAIGMPPVDLSKESFVVVTEYNRHVQGFLVSQVERIVNLAWKDVHAPPGGMGNHAYLTAVTEVEGKLVEIVDVEKVLGDVIGVKTDVCVEARSVDDNGWPRHVYFADDSLVARKQIKRVLDQIEFSYESADNGRAALERLREIAEAGPVEEQIGLVISDIEMPEMDGYTLTREIRADPKLKNLRVVLHTSLSGNFNTAMVKKVGADRLLGKFDPNELAHLVRELFALEVAPAAPGDEQAA